MSWTKITTPNTHQSVIYISYQSYQPRTIESRQDYHSFPTFPFRIDLTSRLAILSPFLLLVRIFLEQNQYHASNIQSPYHCSMRFVRKTIEWRNDAPFSRNEKIEGRGNIPLVAPESSYVFTGAWTARASSPLMKISKLEAHRESVISRGRR